MKRTLATAALFASLAPLTAMADSLPPPPTKVYTPATQSVCEPFDLNVYFQPGESVLNQHALDVIQAAAERAEGCAIARLDMASLAVETNRRAPQKELAAERLKLVRGALLSQGVKAQQVETNITALPASLSAEPPMARRVEVTIAAYRPQIG